MKPAKITQSGFRGSGNGIRRLRGFEGCRSDRSRGFCGSRERGLI